MKTTRFRRRGFSVMELAVVLGVFALLVLIVIPMMSHPRAKQTSQRMQCVNNQKQIGTAYRIWAGDNGDRSPAQVSNLSSNGGWGDFLKLTNAGVYCWSNYAIIQNELGQSPRVLICPSDDREAAKDFKNLKNKNVSYFFGTGATENFPMSIQGGDRNLAPGSTPKNDFGYSPRDDNGNDVILQTNAPVCWSLRIHSAGNVVGCGIVLLGDGSVQQVSSARFISDLQSVALDAGSFPIGYINRSNSFRLIFP